MNKKIEAELLNRACGIENVVISTVSELLKLPEDVVSNAFNKSNTKKELFNLDSMTYMRDVIYIRNRFMSEIDKLI